MQIAITRTQIATSTKPVVRITIQRLTTNKNNNDQFSLFSRGSFVLYYTHTFIIRSRSRGCCEFDFPYFFDFGQLPSAPFFHFAGSSRYRSPKLGLSSRVGNSCRGQDPEQSSFGGHLEISKRCDNAEIFGLSLNFGAEFASDLFRLRRIIWEDIEKVDGYFETPQRRNFAIFPFCFGG